MSEQDDVRRDLELMLNKLDGVPLSSLEVIALDQAISFVLETQSEEGRWLRMRAVMAAAVAAVYRQVGTEGLHDSVVKMLRPSKKADSVN